MSFRTSPDNKLSHYDRIKQEGVLFGFSNTYNGSPGAGATIGTIVPPAGFNLWVTDVSIGSDSTDDANVQFSVSEPWNWGDGANQLTRRGIASERSDFHAIVNGYANGGTSCGFSVRDAMTNPVKLVSSLGGVLVTDDLRLNARYKLLMLGDSVTVGSVGAIGTFTGSDIFPWQVRDCLLDNKCDIRLINKGLGGKNSTNLENYRLARGVDVDAHLVLYSMGINDVGGGSFNEETYRANVTNMIAHTRRLYRNRVFLLLGPSPVFQDQRHENLQLLRAAGEALVGELKEAGDAKLFYHNMGEAFDRKDENYYSLTDISERPTDMVHPNKAGHLLLTQGITQFMSENNIIKLIR